MPRLSDLQFLQFLVKAKLDIRGGGGVVIISYIGSTIYTGISVYHVYTTLHHFLSISLDKQQSIMVIYSYYVKIV